MAVEVNLAAQTRTRTMMTISRPKGNLVIMQDRSSDDVSDSSIYLTIWSHLSGRFVAIAALVLANVIFGTTFVATKPMLDRIPPLTIATGRFAIALLVLMPLLLRSGRRPNFGRNSALLGFVGVFVLYFSQNLGLEMTSATNGALIHGGVPVFTMLIAGPVLAERLNASRLAGVVVSLVGVGAVILCGNGAKLTLSLAGDALILLSAAAMAAYLVIGRRAFAGEGALETVAGGICYGLLFLIPASGAEIVTRGIERPTNGDLACWIYLGVFASALAWLFECVGLRHLEASQVGLFTNLSPLVGIVVAALFLGESISIYQIGGGVLILGGVWFATKGVDHHQVQPLTEQPLNAQAVDDLVLTTGSCDLPEMNIAPAFSTIDLEHGSLRPTFADDLNAALIDENTFQ
jgi:drug/metabolite transporter (DMT)-like permease